MKEYKAITPALGMRNKVGKLEDILNKHAKDGWNVITITANQLGAIVYIIFERNKNR